MKQKTQDVLFEEIPGKEGDIGLMTLNRPQVLNALSHSMLTALSEHLKHWQTQPHIKAVLIRACEGRAFCAGGDIRSVYERHRLNDPFLLNYFHDEYHLNALIHHYAKPYIALLDGMTMGGGAGLSWHGLYRIGTEHLRFAMPETGIGFYPDVGTTYLLARLPYRMGYYLGLTGMRITAADCLALGIIQYYVKRESLLNILLALTETSFESLDIVTSLLDQFTVPSPPSDLMRHTDEISSCFSQSSIEEITEALKQSSSPWCHHVVEILQSKSPTSLKITLQALQKAEHLSFDECIEMEKNLAQQFLQGHDFFEGIRAAIIEKDHRPVWHFE